jgi:hypothetical protein
MLKKSAPKKPLIEKPSTSFEHKAMITALMTSKNNPRVKTVIGKVKITKIGFTNKFNKPNTIATITADLNPSTWAILGKKLVIVITNKVVISILISSFILKFILFFISKTLPFVQKITLGFQHEANDQRLGL